MREEEKGFYRQVKGREEGKVGQLEGKV